MNITGKYLLDKKLILIFPSFQPSNQPFTFSLPPTQNVHVLSSICTAPQFHLSAYVLGATQSNDSMKSNSDWNFTQLISQRFSPYLPGFPKEKKNEI